MRVANPSARTFLGTGLMDKQSDPKESTSSITTRKFDVELYDRTGELKYLEEGTKMPAPNATKSTKLMRSEITNIEQFEAIGSYGNVAKKYGVSKSTAHGWMRSLRAKAEREAKEEKEMDHEMSQGPCEVEMAQGFPEMEVSEVEMNPSETYHVPVEENVFCADCGGLFVPKDRDVICQNCAETLHQIDYPEQYDGHEESVNKIEEELMSSSIETSWENIKYYLADIRRIEIERVDKRIKAKFEEMLGVTA